MLLPTRHAYWTETESVVGKVLPFGCLRAQWIDHPCRHDPGFCLRRWQVEGRDVWWQDVILGQPTECEVTWCEAEHPLFKASGVWLGVGAGGEGGQWAGVPQ